MTSLWSAGQFERGYFPIADRSETVRCCGLLGVDGGEPDNAQRAALLRERVDDQNRPREK